MFALLGAFFIQFNQTRRIDKRKNCDDETSKSSVKCQRRKRSPVGVGHVPYQVSLQRVSNISKVPEHFCGGVIIRPNWILTSAHCFDNDKSVDFTISYGGLHDKSAMTVAADRLILHPNYRQNASVSSDDLALIRTKNSLQLNNGGLAYPIKVATSEVTQGKVTVSGWPGAIIDSSSNEPVSVRPFCKIQMPIVPSEASNHKYLLSNMFCVVDGNKNSTPADYSGGSAVQNGELVGLVCGGKACSRPGRPGLYTSVAKYAHWIDEQIELVEQQIKKAA